jgi:hypothetical protein
MLERKDITDKRKVMLLGNHQEILQIELKMRAE